MTGIKIKLGKKVRIRNGKVERVYIYRSASHAIAARKSQAIKPVRGAR